MDGVDLRFLAAAGSIVLVDLVLSGDNALVIGAAASRLPRAKRLIAIFWGGLCAILFRLILAIVATELLRVPLLQAIGGAVLLIIAIRLLWPGRDTEVRREASDRLFPAILTILAADATMSLDNVLAVGALAAGNIPLLVAGLLFSMFLLFVASAVIARLIEWLPLLIDLAAVVLGWTAANLIAEDVVVGKQLQLAGRQILPQSGISLPIIGVLQTGDPILWLHVGCVALVLVADMVLRLIWRRRAAAATKTDDAAATALPPASERSGVTGGE
jgi:YjbE family integral membrane protein